jgi:hypothetical protein
MAEKGSTTSSGLPKRSDNKHAAGRRRGPKQLLLCWNLEILKYINLSQGTRIIVIRIHGHHQVLIIPVYFHVPNNSKCFLHIADLPGDGLFESSYGIRKLDLHEILRDYKKRFHLNYRGYDYAVLQPKEPFDANGFFILGSFPVFADSNNDCDLLI